MRKNPKVFTGIPLLIFLLLFAAGCGPQEKPLQHNIIIFRLSNPDEALNALIADTDISLWSAWLDTSSGITATDREVICYHIGVKSANALLAVFLNDYETAEKISGSIKDAADRLNIKSDEIETAAKGLVDALGEKDENKKAQLVKKALNSLKDVVIEALEAIGNRGESVMIEFGAWIEALRQTSSIILENYSMKTASALVRKAEAGYFKARFTDLNLQHQKPRYKNILEMTSKLLDLMSLDETGSISRDVVEQINALAIEINGMVK
ncbi:MAG: hypothetical protein JW881_04820 [Spirochaetales bacterium]|nr:hypothetical protein [Spirochaetales bacterium]